MSKSPRAQKPPVPTLVTIVAVLVAVALIAGAFLLGRSLATAPEPAPTETPTTALAPPAQLAGFQLAETAAPSLAPGVGKEVVHANYTDGTARILLVLSRPEAEVEEFLTNAGITNLTERSAASGRTMCGTSTDTGYAACARLVDDTGRLIVGATDVSAETLETLLDELPE